MSTFYSTDSASGSPISSAPQTGLVRRLFDFSFTSFITPKIIKALYAMSMLIAGVVAIFVIGAGFNVNTIVGLLALVLSPIAFLLVLAYSRLSLELVVVFFRIEEHGAELLRLQHRQSWNMPPPTGTPLS